MLDIVLNIIFVYFAGMVVFCALRNVCIILGWYSPNMLFSMDVSTKVDTKHIDWVVPPIVWPFVLIIYLVIGFLRLPEALLWLFTKLLKRAHLGILVDPDQAFEVKRQLAKRKRLRELELAKNQMIRRSLEANNVESHPIPAAPPEEVTHNLPLV